MSKKRLIIFILVTGLTSSVFLVPAYAGVAGGFDFHLSLTPQTTSSETTEFAMDFEGILDLDVTLSGLTFGTDLAMGVAGIEHYIASLSTTLGALDLKDEFAFAAPYDKGTAPLFLDKKRRGPLLFVKKRVTVGMSLAGLEFTNLLIYEDVNFPSPQTWHPDPGEEYTTEDQSFRFGDIVTIKGETAGGIIYKAITGFGADPQKANVIKKKIWSGAVVDDGQLGFTVEKLILSNLSVAGISFRNQLEVRPEDPISNRLSIRYSIGKLATIRTTMTWDDISELNISGGTLTITSDPITISNSFNTRQLSTSISARFSLSGFGVGAYSTFRTYQELASDPDPYRIHFFELKGFKLHAYVFLKGMRFSTYAVWGGSDAPPVVFDYITYKLSKDLTEHNTFEINATFKKDGFKGAELVIENEFEL